MKEEGRKLEGAGSRQQLREGLGVLSHSVLLAKKWQVAGTARTHAKVQLMKRRDTKNKTAFVSSLTIETYQSIDISCWVANAKQKKFKIQKWQNFKDCYEQEPIRLADIRSYTKSTLYLRYRYSGACSTQVFIRYLNKYCSFKAYQKYAIYLSPSHRHNDSKVPQLPQDMLTD